MDIHFLFFSLTFLVCSFFLTDGATSGRKVSPQHQRTGTLQVQPRYQNPSNFANLDDEAASQVEYVFDGPLGTLYEFLVSHRLQRLCQLLRSANLDSVLADSGSFTLFAPTDASFAFLPGGTLEQLERNPRLLQEFLLHHFVAGDLPSSQIQNDVVVDSVQGRPLRFNIYNQLKTVSGAEILEPDLEFNLGRVHVIDRPLYPIPESDILGFLQANHKQMYNLILSAGLTDYLSGGIFTIFVPNDNAFDYLSVELKDALRTNNSLAYRVALNHVIPGSVFVNGIGDDSQTDALSGTSLNFTQRRGLVFVNDIPIVTPDVPTTNGVIHVINRVLLPEGVDAECHCNPLNANKLGPSRPQPNRTSQPNGQRPRSQSTDRRNFAPTQSLPGPSLNPSVQRGTTSTWDRRQPSSVPGSRTTTTFSRHSPSDSRPRAGSTSRLNPPPGPDSRQVPESPPRQGTHVVTAPSPAYSTPSSDNNFDLEQGSNCGNNNFDCNIPNRISSQNINPGQRNLTPGSRQQNWAIPSSLRTVSPQRPSSLNQGHINTIRTGSVTSPGRQQPSISDDNQFSKPLESNLAVPEKPQSKITTPQGVVQSPPSYPRRQTTVRTRAHTTSRPQHIASTFTTQSSYSNVLESDQDNNNYESPQSSSGRPGQSNVNLGFHGQNINRARAQTPQQPFQGPANSYVRRPSPTQISDTSVINGDSSRPGNAANRIPTNSVSDSRILTGSRPTQQFENRRTIDDRSRTTTQQPTPQRIAVTRTQSMFPTRTRGSSMSHTLKGQPFDPARQRTQNRVPSLPPAQANSRRNLPSVSNANTARQQLNPNRISGGSTFTGSDTSGSRTPSNQKIFEPNQPQPPCRRPTDRITPSTRSLPICATVNVNNEPCQRLGTPYNPSDPRPLCPDNSGCRSSNEPHDPSDQRPLCFDSQRQNDCKPRNRISDSTDRRPLCPVENKECYSPGQPVDPNNPLPPCENSQVSNECRQPGESSQPNDRRPLCAVTGTNSLNCRDPYERPKRGDIRPVCSLNSNRNSQTSSIASRSQSSNHRNPSVGSNLNRQSPGTYPQVQYPASQNPPSSTHLQRPVSQTVHDKKKQQTSHTSPQKPVKQPISSQQLPSSLGGNRQNQRDSTTHRLPQNGCTQGCPNEEQPNVNTGRHSQRTNIRQTQHVSTGRTQSHSGNSQPVRTESTTDYSNENNIENHSDAPLQGNSLSTSDRRHNPTIRTTPSPRVQRPPSPPRGSPPAQRQPSRPAAPQSARQPTGQSRPAQATTGTTPSNDGLRSLYQFTENPNLVIAGRPVTLNKIFELFQKAGLDYILTEPGPYTVFLPSDDAFLQLPKGVVEQLEENPELLRQVLLYHVIDTEVPPGGEVESFQVPTLNGMPMVVTMLKGGKLILVAGAKAIAVTRASNGIFYVINKLLYPLPQDNLYTALQNRPDLSTVTYLIEISGLTDMIQGDKPYTIFAPTNDAFAQLPEAVLEEFAKNTTMIRDLLLGHIIDGAHYGREFLTGGSFPNARGGRNQVSVVTYGYKVNNANIKTPEIVTGTGVIHLIDDILFIPRERSFVEILKRTLEDSANASPEQDALANQNAAPGSDTFSGQIFPSSGYGLSTGRNRIPSNNINSNSRQGAPAPSQRAPSSGSRTPSFGQPALPQPNAGGPNAENLNSGHTPTNLQGFQHQNTHTTLSSTFNRPTSNQRRPSNSYAPSQRNRTPAAEHSSAPINRVSSTVPNSSSVSGSAEASSHTGRTNERAQSPAQGTSNEYPRILQLANDFGFNRFASWITNTKLLDKIQDGGSYTIFAPTDEAIQSLPPNLLQALESDSEQTVPLLKYHIVPQSLSPGSLGNDETSSTLLEGKKLRFNVYNNGQTVTAGGIPLQNPQDGGSPSIKIIPVDQVLQPPSGDLLSMVDEMPDLTELSTALRATRLTWTLSGMGPLTLFAPSNRAFEALSPEQKKYVLDDKQGFANLLKSHLIRGTVFSSGLQDENKSRTQNGKSLNFSASDGVITVNSVPVVYADIVATNGVLHIIDEFL